MRRARKATHILVLTQEEYLDVLGSVSHQLAELRAAKSKRLPGAYHRLQRLMDRLSLPATLPSDYMHVKIE